MSSPILPRLGQPFQQAAVNRLDAQPSGDGPCCDAHDGNGQQLAKGAGHFQAEHRGGQRCPHYGGKKPGFISGGTLNNFAGASGGGATITPVAFLIVTGDSVKLVSADGNNTYADKIADMAKDIFIGLNRG